MSVPLTEIRKIDSVLLDHLQPNTEILKHETRILTAPGENYGSVMLAVDVTVREPEQPPKTLHLVAKRIPANELLCQMFNIQNTFKKEIAMYSDAIPAITKFQEEYGNKERRFSDLFARSYGARINLTGNDVVDYDAVLFLENLKVAGFDVEDRLVGFDKDQAYKILEDLARFHAIPIAYKIKKPDEFKKIVIPVLKPVKIADGFSEEMKKQGVDEVIELLQEHKEFQPVLDVVHKTLTENMDGYVRFAEAVEPFATAIHSDYWVNNTMIKKVNGKVLKNIIVDMQLQTYGSGAMDLLFFLFTSIQPEILYDHIDEYIKFYHECFIECLQEFDLDVTPFRWENFIQEVNRIACLELGHILIMYKPILAKRGTIEDMAKVDSESMGKKSEKNEDYENRVIRCVRFYMKHKWL